MNSTSWKPPHRPPVLKGVRSRDLRIKFYRGKRSRGFYARWRPNLNAWECQLSGDSMQPRRWFSPSQTMALAELRMLPSLFDWQSRFIDESHSWDGVRDAGFDVGKGTKQLPLFSGEWERAA